MTKRKVCTEIRGDAHSYTRSKVPWTIGSHGKTCGDLTYYIAGGGMKAFGRTIKQDAESICHRRFLVVSAVLAILWLVFWIF